MSDNKAMRGSVSQIILNSLLSGDKYGYEICKEIEEKTNGALILKQPSLYSSLRRMEEQKLIDSYWQDSEIGGKRHYYKLTEKGKVHLSSTKQDFEISKKLIENTHLESDEETKTNSENDKNTANLPENKEEDSTTSVKVVKQENLFNLTKTNKPPQIIEEKKAEESSTYFQFDLFNSDTKFIKTNEEKNFETPSTFSNKYKEEDNHKNTIQSQSPIIAAEQVNEQIKLLKETENELLLEETEDQSISQNIETNIEQVNEPSLADNASLSNDEKDGFDFINNQDGFSPIKNIDSEPLSEINENDSVFPSEEEINFKANKEHKSIGSFLKSMQVSETANTEDENNFSTFDISSLLSNSNTNQDNQDIDSNEKSNKNSATYITQYYDESEKKSLIDNNIYLRPSTDIEEKSYSTTDQYNPIKYATNDSANGNYILSKSSPHSDNKNYQDVLENLYNPNKILNINDIKDLPHFDQDINSNENLSTLKDTLKQDGIKLKEYTKFNLKFKPRSNYINYNKLNMVKNIIVSSLAIFEIWILFMILSLLNLVHPAHLAIYIVATVLCVIYMILFISIYLFKPDYNIISSYKFSTDLLNKALAVLICLVFIFAINLFVGMTSLNQLDYLSYWLLPALISTNFIIASVCYLLLLKSKKFSV